ncbi:hypothetical protein ACFQE1_20045 [Halobium palmae]|uniref:Uncharacterized protein n=1 Tax=Halobium palmae TaxID=1776492 RepID=A0ABD5S4W9_9EURY
MSTKRPTVDAQSDARPLFTGFPSGVVPYVAILAALVSASIHLWLAPMIVGFDRTRAVLFVLAGLGFLCGIAVYLSRYWRREFYLVAAAFALAQIAAFFVVSGRLDELAILSKSAETVFAVAATYLYVTDDSP